jgi:hypothetical protein
MRDASTPRARFAQHKAGAKKRGIEFLLTFEQWWGLWEPHWEKRGLRALDMCMCRKADKGPYEVGNVRIATVKENQQERALEYRTAHAQRKYRVKKDPRTLIGEAAPWVTRYDAFREYSEDEETA